MGKTDFFDRIKSEAQERGSLYRGEVKQREALLDFLGMNGWFGQEVPLEGGQVPDPRKTLLLDEGAADAVVPRLDLWLRAYGRSHREKLDILTGLGMRKRPDTTDLYWRFIHGESREDDISSWRLLDFMLFHLPGEFTGLSEDEMDSFVNRLDSEATRAVCDLFAEFNRWAQRETGQTGWGYKYMYRTKRDDIDAYSVRDFSVMAYCIFNEEHWRRERLLEKACSSAAYANLWLFVAMHFVCALRSTDIARLPKPELHGAGADIRQKVMDGVLEDPAAISRDMTIRIRYSPKHPNKTLAYGHVPEIKVFLPTSLEQPLGTIMAVAASYREDVKAGESFIKPDRNRSRIRKFFGETFMEATGGRGFASIRANKAYLQGLEMTAGGNDGHVKGYMVAALARSHKGAIGSLPSVTDIYLKDASFSSYKAEFIAREMFERGVFGFVPHLLLDVYAGREYESLEVTEQTMAIKEVMISASGIEAVVSACGRALNRAKITVGEILADNTDVGSVLQRIASGGAVGKQEGCLCAMTAAGFGCRHIDRPSCIGCRYEIHTKAFLQQIAGEYARMMPLATGDGGWRYAKMMREVLLPIASEYLAEMRQGYPDSDMEGMAEILKGGLEGYGDGSKQDGERRLQPVSDC